MIYEYDREEFLGLDLISQRLLPEIISVFKESYFSHITEEEISNLLTLTDAEVLKFDIIYILDHYTGQHYQDVYYDLSSKLKNVLGNFCYDYRGYSFNWSDFPL